MKRLISVGLTLLFALLLAPEAARAENGPAEQGANGAPEQPSIDPEQSPLPQRESGILAVGGGARYTFPNSLNAGVVATSHSLGPVGAAAFLYQVDRTWAIMIELGYGQDWFTLSKVGELSPGSMSVQTVTIQLGAQWTPDFGWKRVQPYAAGGFGYYLSTITNPSGGWVDAAGQPNVTGFFGALGLRIALTTRIGLTVEDRYAFAQVGAGNVGSISVGGNIAALGLYIVWKG